MIEALDADLRHLGAQPADPILPVEADATAVLYVLLGSQMGMRVLRKRWVTATDPAVAGAGRIFNLRLKPVAWQTLCAEMTGQAAGDEIADRVAEDACRVFEVYIRALANGAEGALPGSGL
ncbi:biliverdin-producing heme oxygenase [Cereibacter changlensis]|nr:biliverdin-producing heme oxygenase [Cereibacter changlensis]